MYGKCQFAFQPPIRCRLGMYFTAKTGVGKERSQGRITGCHKIAAHCQLCIASAILCLNYWCLYTQIPPRWWLHITVVRGFEYARDPESYTSGSVASGRASRAGQAEG
jgi:hypothetical protein